MDCSKGEHALDTEKALDKIRGSLSYYMEITICLEIEHNKNTLMYPK